MLTIKLKNPIKNKKGEQINEIIIDCSRITGRMMIDAETMLFTKGIQPQDCVMNLQYQLILASKISGIAISVLCEALNANELYQIAREIKFFMMLGEKEATQTKENTKENIKNIENIIESTK